MNLREWLAKRPDDTPETAARRLLAERPEDAVALIADRISHMRREWAREVEVRVGEALFTIPAGTPVVPQAVSLASFHELMTQPFSVGNGVEVTWGLATVEHHQMRVDLLTRQRDGISRTIRLHTQAISVLNTTGASCLAEVS